MRHCGEAQAMWHAGKEDATPWSERPLPSMLNVLSHLTSHKELIPRLNQKTIHKVPHLHLAPASPVDPPCQRQ